MATYYINDDGNDSDGSSWANAYTSWQSFVAAWTPASGDIIYVGSDHVDSTTHSANFVMTDSAAAVPTKIISANVSTGAYEKSTSLQLDTSDGAYKADLGANTSLYGLKIKSGDDILLQNGSAEDCTFLPAAGKSVLATGGERYRFFLRNCTIDLSSDSGATSTAVIAANGSNETQLAEIVDCTFTNATNRTGAVINSPAYTTIVSGCDFTGFTNATTCELFDAGSAACQYVVSNCLTVSSWTPLTLHYNLREGSTMMMTNTGPANDPTYLYCASMVGYLLSTTSNYRTGGAALDGTGMSWIVVTDTVNDNCSEGVYEFWTPWIYGTVSSTGSKNFDVYITNDSADFTDAQVWLEVDILADAGEATWTRISDHRATITTTPVAQDDDTESEWNGPVAQFLYKQRLRATGTVGQAGLYRARVKVATAPIATTAYFRIDPKVTVS